MSSVKKAASFTSAIVPLAVLAGWFTAQYSLATMDPALLEQSIAQLGSRSTLVLVTVIQTVLFALVSAFFGYLLSERVGLMRPIRFQKKVLPWVVILSVAFGIFFSLDAWTFGVWCPELADAYVSAKTFDLTAWLASILYGGVVEELMMRLFVMSLLVFLLQKLFRKGEETVSTAVLVGANLIAALLFAAGHLPATFASFGHLTPLLLLRCFILNGAFGLLFGRLYRKYGIQYAMLSHAILHIVSKTMWLVA